MRKIHLLLLSFVFLINSAIAQDIGINLGPVTYYSASSPFIDIFKTGQQWFTEKSGTFNTGEQDNIPTDADGYPMRIDGFGADGSPVAYTKLSVLLLRSFPPPFYPAGRYILTWDGDGVITVGMNAVKVSQTPGRMVVNVATPTQNGVSISILSTNPQNHIRNMHFYREANEADFNAGKLFTKEFLAFIEPFKKIRYMDWQNTNASQQVAWADRPKLGNAFWDVPKKGVPLEVIFALANETKTDLWLNMPHQADDNYIAEFAGLARAMLTQNQKVVIEYGNETWNFIFPQTKWVTDQGKALWPTSTLTDYAKNRNFYGMKTAQMCDIWRSMWASDSGRLTCALGAQAVDTSNTSVALNCDLWTHGRPCGRKHGVTAVAIAPYFGKPASAYNAAWTIDHFFDTLNTDDTLARSYSHMINFAGFARANGLDLLAYEGGPSFIGKHPYYIAADATDQMAALVGKYLDAWRSYTNDAPFYFYSAIAGPGEWGQFGLSRSIYAQILPKYQAVTTRLQ